MYLFPLYSLPAGDNGQFRFVAGLCGKPGKDGWLEIWLAGKWWWPEHTIVHELGHAVQYRLLGAEWSWDGKVGEYLKLKNYPASLDLAPGDQERLPWDLKASEWFARDFEAVYGPEGSCTNPRIRDYFSNLFAGKPCADGKRRTRPAARSTSTCAKFAAPWNMGKEDWRKFFRE